MPPVPQDLLTAGRRHRHTLDMDVFTAARERTAWLYQHYNTIIVSWSGGKDSSVCLELALEAATAAGKLPGNVLFNDEEVIYPETVALAYKHAADPRIKMHWICVPAKYRNACSNTESDFIPWDPARKELWTHQAPDFALWPAGHEVSDWRNPPPVPVRAAKVIWPKETHKVVVQIVGLRAEESFARYTGVMSSGAFITQPLSRMITARPIYDWKARDVWLAIKTYGWEYNLAYEKLRRSGRTITTCRIAPLFGAEAAMHLRSVAVMWPQFWTAVRKRVRGAQAVANYGGLLHLPKPNPGESWQHATFRMLSGLDEKDQFEQFRNIKDALHEHSRHTDAPMHDTRACSGCSLSWKLIARAVTLGDRHAGRMFHRQGFSVGDIRAEMAPTTP